MSESNGKGALQEWKNLATFEATLPSGIHVKAKYLDFEQVLMAGQIDIAVLEGLDKKAATPAAKRTAKSSKAGENPKQIAEGLRYKQHVVCTHLLEVSGEPVTVELEDFFALPEADRDKLFRYIQRSEPPFSRGLTLPDIAAFAVHPSGIIYEAVYARYGVDPAGFIEDPYLAWQLRLALFCVNARRRDPNTPDDQEQELIDEMTALLDV